MFEHARLYIDGAWRAPRGQGMAEVIDPASESVIGACRWHHSEAKLIYLCSGLTEEQFSTLFPR